MSYYAERLERGWLIATADSESLAAEIKNELETEKCKFIIEPLSHPYELLRAKEVVEHIYRSQLGELPEEDVIADFTGGTKPMAVGMICACLSPSRSLQYMPARYDAGKPDQPLDPVEYAIDYDESAKPGANGQRRG